MHTFVCSFAIMVVIIQYSTYKVKPFSNIFFHILFPSKAELFWKNDVEYECLADINNGFRNAPKPADYFYGKRLIS